MSSLDWKNISENFSLYVNNKEFIRSRSVDEICTVLDNVTLSPSQFDTFFSNLASFHDTIDLMNIVSHANVEYTDDLSENLNNISTLSFMFKFHFLKKLRDSINNIYENVHKDALITVMQALIELKGEKNNNTQAQNRIDIKALKKSQQSMSDENENKTSQSRNHSSISKHAKNNFEELSKLDKTSANFEKIYSIFKKISNENDIESAKLAVKDGYHNVTDKYSWNTIVSYAGKKNNFDLVKLLVDCDVDPSDNGEGSCNALWWFCVYNNLAAVKYFCENPLINRNAPSKGNWSLLHEACKYDYFEICEYLLTKDGVDVNMRNDDGNTPLYTTKYDRIRNLLLSHGAIY